MPLRRLLFVVLLTGPLSFNGSALAQGGETPDGARELALGRDASARGSYQEAVGHLSKAVQALGNPKVVNLETIEARFAVAEDVRANLVARAGIYDANTQKLTLDGGIEITTTNGYSGSLEHADVDIEKGTVFSETGVLLRGKEGQITADSIEVLDQGKHIFFRGNVKLHFTPPEETATDKAGDGSGATPGAASAPATEINEPAPDGAT